MMTTLNTPGIYGAYDLGITSFSLYNREPQFYPAYPQRAVIPELTTTIAPIPPNSEASLSAQAPVSDTARVHVHVPADAELSFQGVPMSTGGTDREFVTPALVAGRGYSYDVQASWMDNGQEVRRSKRIYVHAGDRVHVDLTEGESTLKATQPLPPPSR